MRLPRFTAQQGAAAPGGTFRSASARPNVRGVGMSLNVGCLLGCGANALNCIHCGKNIGCWLQCAGPGTVDCVRSCF